DVGGAAGCGPPGLPCFGGAAPFAGIAACIAPRPASARLPVDDVEDAPPPPVFGAERKPFIFGESRVIPPVFGASRRPARPPPVLPQCMASSACRGWAAFGVSPNAVVVDGGAISAVSAGDCIPFVQDGSAPSLALVRY